VWRTLPVARRLISETGGTLLEVCVGQRSVWKSPDHPFRHDSELQLSGIPTVIRWTPSGPAERAGAHLDDIVCVAFYQFVVLTGWESSDAVPSTLVTAAKPVTAPMPFFLCMPS